MYSIKNIRKAVNLLRLMRIKITTVSIIEILQGFYLIDFGITPIYSSNALYGKFLKRNAQAIGITWAGKSRIKVRDSWTNTSVWR